MIYIRLIKFKGVIYNNKCNIEEKNYVLVMVVWELFV